MMDDDCPMKRAGGLTPSQGADQRGVASRSGLLRGQTREEWPAAQQGQWTFVVLKFPEGTQVEDGSHQFLTLKHSLPAGDEVHVYQNKPKKPILFLPHLLYFFSFVWECERHQA